MQTLAAVATVVGVIVAVATFVLGLWGPAPSDSTDPSPPQPVVSLPSSSGSSPTPSTTPDPTPDPTAPSWPDYPGVASVGVSGRVAEVWQQILIQCGVIGDIPSNRDGYFGPATGEKLRQVESHWANWVDPDTTADRLTYHHIVTKGCD